MKKYVATILLSCSLMLTAFSQQEQKTNQTDDRGRKQGLWIELVGELEYKGDYVDNQKDGQWLTHFKENGQLFRIENYKADKKDGLFLELSKQGYLTSEQYFTNNLPNGVHNQYGQGGYPISENNYSDGKYNGLQVTYYENIRKKSEEATYKYGVKDGPSRWYSMEGELVAEYVEYYDTGAIKTSGQYKSSLKDGKWIEYDEKGNVIKTSVFVNGKEK
jgi:antitoxin component YwqK of YwqJK toxin-antitoxin module